MGARFPGGIYRYNGSSIAVMALIAVEYGLIAALVAISLFAALGNYYDIMTSIFGSVSNGLNSAQH